MVVYGQQGPRTRILQGGCCGAIVRLPVLATDCDASSACVPGTGRLEATQEYMMLPAPCLENI
eukprot:scaffold86169_cov46-Attheya_sp.AAC.3